MVLPVDAAQLSDSDVEFVSELITEFESLLMEPDRLVDCVMLLSACEAVALALCRESVALCDARPNVEEAENRVSAMPDFLAPVLGEYSAIEPNFIDDSIETGSGASLPGFTLLDAPDVIFPERLVAATEPPYTSISDKAGTLDANIPPADNQISSV